MYPFVRTVLAAFSLFLLISLPCQAIDLAVPSDMFPFTIEILGDVGEDNYYFIDPFALNPQIPMIRGYLLILDANGEIVWFKDAGEDHFTNLQPHEQFGWYSHSLGSGDSPVPTIVLDSGFEVIKEFGPIHPNGMFEHDPHEFMIMPDSSYWTLWRDPQQIDMSALIEGGLPDAVIQGHVIEHWDSAGNILWSWRSLDHVDMLPILARPDSSALFHRLFEHLHMNSFELCPDSTILASTREMSIIFKIDMSTGDVIWRMGGGPANDFTFSGPAGVPWDFNLQHDGRQLENGNITVFDNGFLHRPPLSYVREYEIDEETFTANLVDVRTADPPSFAYVTGSFRHLDDGHELVCWGNFYPTTHASEYDENGDLAWELRFEVDHITHVTAGGYRIIKSTQFTPSTLPHLNVHITPDSTLELTCNWFGHEEEVDQYLIFLGHSKASATLLGTTYTGHFEFSNGNPALPHYFRIQAANENGEPISDYSDWLKFNAVEAGLVMIPQNTEIPEEGGDLTFSVEMTSTYPGVHPGVHFWTEAILPDGELMTPIFHQQFTVDPFMVYALDAVSQPVPEYAPPGVYTFIASVGFPGTEFLASDSFEFTKLGEPDTTSVTISEWPSTQGLSQWFISDAVDLRPIPREFTLHAAYPNPFNASTLVTVTLPESADLSVVVFDILGQQVDQLAAGRYSAGEHRLIFDATGLASGLYFVHAIVPGRLNETQKVMLVR
jgi:Arylsulfotransferase (ASST)/Secretion system C-terminal sorting domain